MQVLGGPDPPPHRMDIELRVHWSVDKNSIDGLKECIESPHLSTLFIILFVQPDAVIYGTVHRNISIGVVLKNLNDYIKKI